MRFISLLRSFYNRLFNRYVGTIDVPDSRDYPDVVPRVPNLPTYINLLDNAEREYFRQRKTFLEFFKQSTNSCSAYALWIWKTITNLCKDGQIIKFDPELQWLHQEQEAGATRADGCTLQGAMKMGKKYPQGFPFKEYRLVDKTNLSHIKARLATGSPLYTGVNWKKSLDGKSSNYAQMLVTGIWNWFSTALLGGHAVVVIGYDDSKQSLICVEPMWKQWGKNEAGLFYVPYTEAKNMFSMYVMYDLLDK